MTLRKKIWLSCGIPLFLILGIFGWLYFWSASWEKRWVEFRQQAEAEGDDFSWNSSRGIPSPDEQNFLQHPWVKQKLFDRADEKAFLPEVIELLDDSVLYVNDDNPKPEEQAKKLWLDRAGKLLARHDVDLDTLCDAAGRPASSRNFSSWAEMANDESWSALSHWANLLIIRAHYRQMTNDRSGFESDVRVLISLRSHANADRTALAFVVGAGMQGIVNRLATNDLELELTADQKKFWQECLSEPPERMEDALMHMMKAERNAFLDAIEKDLPKIGSYAAKGLEESFWQRNIFVQKALFAGNRLMLCEDFHQTIASPQLRGETIEWKHFEEFEKRIRVHREENALRGRIGLAIWQVMGSMSGSVHQLEKERRKLRRKFSQSP